MADNVTNSSIFLKQNNSHIAEVSLFNDDQIYEISMTEKICYSSVILIFCLWIYVSNSTLIAVLLKYRVTTKLNRIIRIILALTDMSICSLAFCMLIPLLFMDSLFNLQFCSIVTDTAYALIYFSIMITATLAVERYVYLIKPLKYHLWLKSKYVVSFLLTFFTFLLLYFLIIGQVQKRQYDFTELTCPAKRPGKIHLALRICMLFVLPAVVIALVLIKTTRLHTAQMVQQQLVKSMVTKSFKLILLLSSSFIITTFPLYILRMIIVGIVQKGTYLVILMRISVITMLLLSSALNPLIQFFIETDLFVGVLKLLGKNADFSWQREMKKVVNVRKMQLATKDL